ncbi:MAG: hypothetical protein AAFY59_18950 [Pseudomonadota bacterium]
MAGVSATLINGIALIYLAFRLAFWAICYSGIEKAASGPRTLAYIGGLVSNIALAGRRDLRAGLSQTSLYMPCQESWNWQGSDRHPGRNKGAQRRRPIARPPPRAGDLRRYGKALPDDGLRA